MTQYFPIVIETESSGAISAYVPGLPVYAAADKRPQVERAIRGLLKAYLSDHPDTVPMSIIRVARRRASRVDLVGVGALLGAGTSRQKVRASRKNGQLGGRPKKRATA